MLPASSRYGQLLLRPRASAPPLNPDWYDSDSTHTDADAPPAEFEPVAAPTSFTVPLDARGDPLDASDVAEADIYCAGDSRAAASEKQADFWAWDEECALRRRRWKRRFGNPHTRLGLLQAAFEARRTGGGGGGGGGEIPEWTRRSWLAQLVVYYPPVLERLVSLMDLQTLLGLMGCCGFLRRLLLEYPLAWRHISFDVRKRGFRGEREAAIVEDAQHGSKYGAWTGSRLRHTYGAMRLDSAALGEEVRLLSSLPLAGLRYLDLDGSPAAGGRAFNDVLRLTRNTLQVLSVRFCRFVGVADVEKILISCAAGADAGGEDDDDDESAADESDDPADSGPSYRYARLPDCALRTLRIWGIQGDARTYHRISTARKAAFSADPYRTTCKTALPVEISRAFTARWAKSGAAVALDHRGSFTNGMFYIPRSVRKGGGGGPWDPQADGRVLVIARQLGIETDFDDCDADGDCWNHRHVEATSAWKLGVPGLKTARRCSSCGATKKETLCRDCEEHRTCFGCKKAVCRDCDPRFLAVGNQCEPCGFEGRFYCKDCHDATAEALSELAAAKGERGTESCPGGVGLHGGGGGAEGRRRGGR